MLGTCLCNGIVFEVTGPLPNLYQCHCSQCRRQGGSASNSATIVHEKQFSWRSGADLVTQYKDKTGFNSHFCSVCGSPVPNKIGDHALIWLPAGLFEDDYNLQIVAHLYVGSKAKWENILNTGIQFEEMPSLETLVRVLHQENN